MSEEKLIVGEDMICPVTGEHCDDECCPPGAECNLGDGCFDDCCPVEKDESDYIPVTPENLQKYMEDLGGLNRREETVTLTNRSKIFNDIFNIIKKLSVSNKTDEDSYDKYSITYEIEQYILNKKYEI